MDEFRSRYSDPKNPYRNNRPQPVASAESPQRQPAAVPTALVKEEELARKPKKVKKKRAARKWLIIGVIVILVIGATAAGYFFVYKKRTHTIVANPNQSAQDAEKKDTETAKQTAQELRKYIDLPSDTPVLFHVNNVQSLSGNSFFVKAQQGDLVLYYQNAKVAVLYRPDTKRVINYSDNATFNNSSQTTQSQATGQ